MANFDGVAVTQLPPSSSNNLFDVRSDAAVFLNTGVKRNFRKRAWRAESSAFVTWDTILETDPYPYGGTLDPPLGVVIAKL